MKILAAIVTYNPEIEILKENIYSLLNQVDKTIIIDNSSKNSSEIVKILDEEVILISMSENKGIAYALNQALRYAVENEYEWLLTMDQDSKVSEELINMYKEHIDESIAQLTPRIIDINQEDEQLQKQKILVEQLEECITSGCLMNVKVAKELGGFDNDLFIDFVDFDYSWKARKNGYKILKINDAVLYHRLGEAQEIKIISFLYRFIKGKSYSYTYNHNAIRTYYYNRNAIYVNRKYKKLTLKTIMFLLIWDLKKIIFEDDKYKKTKAIILGVIEGIKATIKKTL